MGSELALTNSDTNILSPNLQTDLSQEASKSSPLQLERAQQYLLIGLTCTSTALEALPDQPCFNRYASFWRGVKCQTKMGGVSSFRAKVRGYLTVQGFRFSCR